MKYIHVWTCSCIHVHVVYYQSILSYIILCTVLYTCTTCPCIHEHVHVHVVYY